MSRALSTAAKQSLLSADNSNTIIILVRLTNLKYYDFNTSSIATASDIRICDSFIERISESDTEIIYGVNTTAETGTSVAYTFLPMDISLPTEDSSGSAPRAKITLYDVTKLVLPSLRNLLEPPTVDIRLVMSNTPNTLEADFLGFKLSSINYNQDSISGDLSIDGLEQEPFPCHSFLPNTFPGLF